MRRAVGYDTGALSNNAIRKTWDFTFKEGKTGVYV